MFSKIILIDKWVYINNTKLLLIIKIILFLIEFKNIEGNCRILNFIIKYFI